MKPGGVYIDDTGTPGTMSPSLCLHKDRRSWAAVIVPEDAASNVATALEIFLNGISADYAAKELHFTDIYSGSGAFKNRDIKERFKLFELMATIFEEFQLPIFFQTSSPEFLSEIQPKIGSVSRIGFLNLKRHEHVALAFLLFRVHRFMTDYRQHFDGPLPVIIDQGLAKPGAIRKLGRWGDTFRNSSVEFRESHGDPFLQLADFAAFAIARSQWLLGKGNLKPRDIDFLRIVSSQRLCIINLPSVSISPEEHTTADFDDFLKRDRRAKGLPDDPPKLD
jgi:Protein of unknown function (DUF3800)